MFRVYYNSNPNLPKYITKEVYSYIKDTGKKQIIKEKTVSNHVGKREELTHNDSIEFEELGEAVSFLRSCSYPITKEYELTSYDFEEEKIELLVDKFDYLKNFN